MPATSNLHVSNQQDGKGKRWWTYMDSRARYKWISAMEMQYEFKNTPGGWFARWIEVGMPGSADGGGPGGSTALIIHHTQNWAPVALIHANVQNISGNVGPSVKYPSFLMVHVNRPGTVGWPIFLPDQLRPLLTAMADQIRRESRYIESVSTPGIRFAFTFLPGSDQWSIDRTYIGVGGKLVVDPDKWYLGKYTVDYGFGLAFGASNGQLTVTLLGSSVTTEDGHVHDWVDALARLALENTMLRLQHEVLPPLIAQVNAAVAARKERVSDAYLMPGNMAFGEPLENNVLMQDLAGASLVLELAPS